LCRDWWIYLSKEVSLLGPIVRKIRYGLKLTDSYYLQNGKNITIRRHKDDCLELYQIILDCGTQREGSRYFKFENMWLKSEGFVEQVNRWWATYEFHGLPS
jgi:hypothetical protein